MQKNENATPSLTRQLWDQFRSMKFAVIILVILAIVSVIALFIGEFYPVRALGPGWEKHWQDELGWSDAVFKLFVFFKLHDPFRSWWYQLLLLALSLSLFVCIVDRFPSVLRSLKIGKTRPADQIESLAFSSKLKSRLSVQDILSRLPRGFRYKIEEAGQERRVVGTRGSFARLGPTLTHLGLLCLAVGGLTASFLGFTARVQGLPGDVMENPGFDFKVRVDTFMIEY